ncbi:uncharacterized protein M421DRAFT_426976 [Didymella exigua CBS 183.55]|uniref:Uncharacterized protein n=1 Tax=Didymella exigua CBS 183.55 TaxID=1150837 RepID=A0A6A5R4R5_9PLEO|nr:uncharacterized protein M421DRAFT_426976 [Didymella exigua CBS 183.55]KAF1922389.1 hypothetical protein M421DRAFT_426976 [Didymella exigua CBS 183.55]
MFLVGSNSDIVTNHPIRQHVPYKMPRLPDRASAEEARATAGFSEMEWRSFIDITKDIAREMRETTPDIRWRRVPFNEKCSVMERVNSLLSKEGIPAVEIDLVGWRMSRAIGNLKHSEGRAAKVTTPLPATRSAAPASFVAEPTSSAASEDCTSRPFDPIRDL